MLNLYFDTASYGGRRIINTHVGVFIFREGELEYTRAQYAGEVTLVDRYVGKLLDKIRELDLWENTVVMLLSDHGHPIMEHGILHKVPQCLYSELMDLVYIVYHPDRRYTGTICNAYVSTHDVAPTLLTMVGVKPPVMMEGRNILEWVTKDKTNRREYITSIFGDYIWCRDEEYAYIANLDGNDVRLYNVQEDPDQHTNITKENPEICKKMYKRVLADADGILLHYQFVRPSSLWYGSDLI